MRSAIIGLGTIGRVHAELLASRGEEIVALCDIDPRAAQNAKEKWAKSAVIYSDYKEMLTKEMPDVVHICTPHYLHADMVVFALGKNINVLCEKPLCMNREEIDAILKAEENSKAQLAVCFQNRFLSDTLDLST